MNYINTYSFETIHGLKSINLAKEDLSNLPIVVDILIVSASRGSYYPLNGTLIGALDSQGISVYNLSKDPEIDLRSTKDVWLSKEINHDKIKRIACVEISKRGKEKDVNESVMQDKISSIFALLSMTEYFNISLTTIAMPLIGTGRQKLDPNIVIKSLMIECKKGLETLSTTEQVIISSMEDSRIKELSDSMNTYLGRTHVELSDVNLDEHTKKIIINIITDLRRISYIRFSVANKRSKRHAEFILAIISMLDNIVQHKGFELFIASRRILEVMVSDLSDYKYAGALNGGSNLNNNIDSLCKELKTAKWIKSYMHFIRILGNTAAHDSLDDENPEFPDSNDIRILILALSIVISYWKSYVLEKSEVTA